MKLLDMGERAKLQLKQRYGEAGIAYEFTRVDDIEYKSYCKTANLNPSDGSYTCGEFLAIVAGRHIPDGAFLFAGTGLPIVGGMLAQHTYAPNSTIILESGIVGPKFQHLPISVSDPRAAYQCATLGGLADAFGALAMRGYCNVGILGGAECDKYGNLNSTTVGDDHLSRRLAGSGGANPIASLADFVIALMVHERRRFPEQCKYLTSPAGARGRIGSTEDRWQYGLYRGKQICVITTLCILQSDEESGELLLSAIYPGVDEKQVYKNTAWELRKSPDFHVVEPPTYDELKVLRFLVDPQRIFLGRTTGNFAATGLQRGAK